jgi:hypothetical protein
MGSLESSGVGMARFDKGYFKAWRSMYDGDLADNPILFALWNSLLHMAYWKEGSIFWDGGRRTLPPGSVVFGIREFANRWHTSPNTISRWLKYLVNTGRITLETGTRGSLATICNWESYQSPEDNSETLGEHGEDTERTPSEHEVNLSKEGKKERKEEGKGSDPKFSLSPENLKAASEAWLDTLQRMKAGRQNLIQQEEISIAQAIKRSGINSVVMALRGVANAPKDDFDSSWFLDVTRVLAPKNFLRFVNLGVQAHHKERAS